MQQLTRHRCDVHPLSRRRTGDERSVSGQVDLIVVQGAAALPQVRAGTIKAIANLSPQRSAVDAGYPDRPTKAACPGSICRDGSASSRRRARRRTLSPSSMRALTQALADPAVKAKFTDLGLDVAAPRAADARRARGVPQGRDREVVADHQGRRHQGGVAIVIPVACASGMRNANRVSSAVEVTSIAPPCARAISLAI